MEDSKSFEKVKSKLISDFEPQFICKEKTIIKLYYSKDPTKKYDIFLYNNSNCNEQFITTRTYDTDPEKKSEKYKLITDLVDNNFLKLINKTQLFENKKSFIVESDIYKIGDCTFEFSKFYMESEPNRKFFIFCINNPYGSKFNECFCYIKGIMSYLFSEVKEEDFIKACEVNEEFLKKNSLINDNLDEENDLNNIMSKKFPEIKLLQYINFIFRL